MQALGLESIASALAGQGYFVKCIVNHSSAVFFPGTIQHRDVKREGASYGDDYRGNALAATITPGMIDVRFHRDYADLVVKALFDQLLALPGMEWAARFTVRYQGRVLKEDQGAN